MQLLILLVVIVGIVAVGQLAKVYELSSRISGHREEDISHADTRLNANLFLAFVIVFFASTAYLYWAYGDYAPPPASAPSRAPTRSTRATRCSASRRSRRRCRTSC